MAKANKNRAPQARAPNEEPSRRVDEMRSARVRVARMLRLCSIGGGYSDSFNWRHAYWPLSTESLRDLFDPPRGYFDKAETALAFMLVEEPEGNAERVLRQLQRRMSIAAAPGEAPTMEIVARALRVVEAMLADDAALLEQSPFGIPMPERMFLKRDRAAGEHAIRSLFRRGPDQPSDDGGGDELASGSDAPRLDSTCNEILRAMLKLYSADTEKPTEAQIRHMIERTSRTSRCNKPIRARLNGVLRQRGLVERDGRKRGYWLTENGRNCVENQLKHSKRNASEFQ
jgi:hypothetical protein